MEAKLTWVRLNAELKNWRNVGRESLAFLGERRSALARKGGMLRNVGSTNQLLACPTSVLLGAKSAFRPSCTSVFAC